MPTLYNFAKREEAILKELSKELKLHISVEAIQKIVSETGFSKRRHKFQAAMAIISMLSVIARDAHWSQRKLWLGYRRDMIRLAQKLNIPLKSYLIQAEVFNDHLKKKSFRELVRKLRQTLADSCLNGSLRDYENLVEVLKNRIGIAGVAIADGTEVHVTKTMSEIFKGPVDGQLKVHKLMNVQSATPLSEKITSGTYSEREALLESCAKLVGNYLILADAGYLGERVFSHLIGTGKKFIIKLTSDSSRPVHAWQKIYDRKDYKPSAAKESPRNLKGEPLYQLNDKGIFKEGASYDTVVKGSKDSVYRVCKVWLKGSDGVYKHVLFATNISPEELDGFQIAELYRARWAIELSFHCDKGFNSLKAGRTRTKSIIEAFVMLTECLSLIKMMVAQAMEKIVDVTLSLQNIAHHSNEVMEELCTGFIQKQSIYDLLAINTFDYEAMEKAQPSKINRERGKDLALVIRVLRLKPRPTTLGATWHQYYDAAEAKLIAKHQSPQPQAA